MTELTISGFNFTELLRKRLPIYHKAGGGKITLLDTPQQYHLPVTLELLRVLTTEFDSSGVYMTTMKVYSELVPILDAHEVDVSKIYFVDVVSKMYGLEPERTPRCEFVSSPINIQSIKNAVSGYLDKLTSQRRFVVFDSLTTILLYNSLPRIVQFTTDIAEHLKAQHVDAILVMMTTAKGSTNDKLIAELKPILDDRIDIPD
ncbi:hypothetical protein J4439_03205 [Candidatus Woesearchaeota archaeon]|nr:hypothetical protein [Candidatus Woesearchaeota archaeon]